MLPKGKERRDTSAGHTFIAPSWKNRDKVITTLSGLACLLASLALSIFFVFMASKRAQEELRKAGLHLPIRSLHVPHQEPCVGSEASLHVPHQEPCVGSKAQAHQQENEEIELSIVALLKACAKQKDLQKGNRIHADVLQKGLFPKNIFIGSTLVNLYAKCGAIAKARMVFNELPDPDLVSWNVLIAGYAQHDRGEDALKCFEQMQDEGLSPSAVTFACTLKACSSIGAIKKGKELHFEIVRRGLLEENRVLGTALVDMYAKCGALIQAQEVFEGLCTRDIVSWNALIVGYAQHGHSNKALNFFEQMQSEGLSPNSVTLLCVLQACGNIKAVDKGKEVHAQLAREGLLGKDGMFGTALLDMYAKSGALTWAQEVFDKLSVRDAVAWNALLAGYCQHGHDEEVLNYIQQMHQDGLYPNNVTLLCALQACANTGAAEKGSEIHAEIIRQGLLGKDNVLGNALVDMYAKCGALARAQEVFDELPLCDRVTWTALIAGYCQQGHGEEALKCFKHMQHKGLSPDAVTYACLLQACGSIGAAEMGKNLHAEIIREGLLGKDCTLGSALVDMYAKCGEVVKAQEVFDRLLVQNVDSWTALITAFAQVGMHDRAFEEFNKMVGEGIEPSLVTFIVLLNACSRLGLMDEGQMYYESMSATHGIIPTPDHYSCMVDLFGRVGHFDKVTKLIRKMPSSNYLPLWFSLLDACKKGGNTKLGKFAFDHIVKVDTL